MSATAKRYFVVKVQFPLHSTDPDLPYLVYDELRRHTQLTPKDQVPQHVVDLLSPEHPKDFFRAAWIPSGWELGDKVQWESW